MSQQNGANDAEFDPFGPWRTLRDATMESWAKSMAEAVNTEAFAQNLGAYLNTYLATSAPLQQFVEQYMQLSLSRLNMPSRDEVLSLSRRMTSVETRLDDLDAKTDRILRALHTLAEQGPTRVAERFDRLDAQLEGLAAPRLADSGPAAPPSAIDDRLQVLDERTDRLLELLQAMQHNGAQPQASAAAPSEAASAPSKAQRKGRTARVAAEPATESQKSAQDAADDAAIEPFQNANA
jgi:hypothetical protein